MLSVRDLTLAYGDFRALDHVDLDVGDGEIVCVLGPSGSGKSSLLRVVAGLEPDAHGTVAWDGHDLRSVPAHRRDFGLMFQDHALFPHRDVLGNVGFGLRMQGLPKTDIDRRAHAALALVGLDDFATRRITELSGGEQQRVALARSLAAEPRLLMLDEPLGALDRALRDRLVAELRALFTRLGLAILFVAQFLGWNVTTVFGPTLAVRPDDLRLVPGATVQGRVTARTFHGERYLLEVAVDGHEPLRIGLPLSAVSVPEVGDAVGLEPVAGAGVVLP